MLGFLWKDEHQWLVLRTDCTCFSINLIKQTNLIKDMSAEKKSLKSKREMRAKGLRCACGWNGINGCLCT